MGKSMIGHNQPFACNQITRRGFLGCLIAVPTLAAIPHSVISAADRVGGQVSSLDPSNSLIITQGKIYDILFWYEGIPQDSHGAIGVKSLDGSDLLQCGINTRATFRWVASPGGELIATEKSPAIIFAQRVTGLTPRVSAHVECSETGNRYFYGDDQHPIRLKS